MKVGAPLKPILPRFVQFVTVDKKTGCWLWGGALSEGGYGRLCVNNKDTRAHRVSYEIFVGPIPDGLQIDHVCRTRNCVNPKHLEPVTGSENCKRGTTGHHIAEAKRNKTHCPKGHPYSGENLVKWSGGGRKCRICENARGRRKHANKTKRTEIK